VSLDPKFVLGKACVAPTALLASCVLRTQRLRTGLTCFAPPALKRGLPLAEKGSGVCRTYRAYAFFWLCVPSAYALG
jgi:hypothetical protein